VPPKAPSATEQARVKRAIGRFERLEAAGRCQILYADESGFCLQPCLAYLWQKKGQRAVGLPAQSHRQRLSVLGLLRKRDGTLWHFPTRGRITAQSVIENIESLLPTLQKPTVLVLDNAGPHRAQAVQDKRPEWKRKGLRLLFLPPYCPHLNAIEILWRQVKYRWLPLAAYQNFERLCAGVVEVLEQVGTRYHLTFA
jgi:hypothetical protein